MSFTQVINAQSLLRLDAFMIEDFPNNPQSVHLYISKNCSICHKQLAILKECSLGKGEVIVYMEGRTEDLRFYIKRNKIPFKSFSLTAEIKKILRFSNISPSLSFKQDEGYKNLQGLQSCSHVKNSLEVLGRKGVE